MAEIYDKQKEQNLINLVKQDNNEDAFKYFVSTHSGIFVKIASKFAPILSQHGMDYQEILEEKDYTIFHAIKTFKPEKNVRFSTYLGNLTRYTMLNKINAEKKYSNAFSDKLDDLTDKEPVIEQNKSLELNEFVYNLLGQLKDSRVIEIFKLRFSDEQDKKMTWKQIAAEMKLSQETVTSLYEKGLAMLKQKVDSEEYLDKI